VLADDDRDLLKDAISEASVGVFEVVNDNVSSDANERANTLYVKLQKLERALVSRVRQQSTLWEIAVDADYGTLANVASVIAAFGAAMIYFGIQREEQMREEGETVWLPLADWLLLVATWCCLLLAIVPIAANVKSRLSASALAFSAVLVAGYLPAILAHYRIVFGTSRSGPRDMAEPLEVTFVAITLAAASGVAAWVVLR
jgi:hypothetical protein